ncbi:hypothetical protein B0O99DRAFT_340745 [Bisporella sp. PMI_857]|nr:hypothetical protein B0O99DRAFT_340745 [Bisporella sp. PMI_857]
MRPHNQLDMQSPVTSKARSFEDSRLLPPHPTALFDQSETLSNFDDLGHRKINSNYTSGPATDVPQELSASSPIRWKQLVGDARIDKEELDATEPHAQVLETFKNPAAVASFYKISLPTCQLSRIAIMTTGLYYITEQSEESTHREAEADANFALRRRIFRLPCVSPSEGQQICCAFCEGETQMTRSYACTQCLRGICQICVARLMAKKWSRRRCPWCSADGAQFQPNH